MNIQVTQKRTWFLTALIGISTIASIAATVTFVLMIFIHDGYFLKEDLELCQRDFSPLPVIFISFDNFRGDTFTERMYPTFSKLKEKGSYAYYMALSFPPSTVANHYSIVTGLYPEFHGMLNSKATAEEVNGINNYFQGEPIWSTLRKRNLLSAIYSWPGSRLPEAHQPTYQNEVENPVEQILLWLNSNSRERPSWISLYIRSKDSDSDEESASQADTTIKELIDALKRENLHSCVNLVMSASPKETSEDEEKIIRFDDVLAENIRDKLVFDWDSATLTFKREYRNEVEALEPYIKCRKKGVEIFRKKELPKHLHYSRESGDYVVLLKDGYSLRVGHPLKEAGTYITQRRGLFLAYGPAFKEDFEVKPFHNIELYNFMCHLLKIFPAPNNGTWGLLEAMLKNPNRVPDMEGNPATGQVMEENRWNQFSDDTNCKINIAATPILKSAYKRRSEVQRQATPWGLPLVLNGKENSNFALLYHPEHITGYSTKLKLPLWTSFTVQKVSSTWQKVNNDRWYKDIRLSAHDSPFCTGKEHETGEESEWKFLPLFPPELFNESAKIVSHLITNGVILSKQLKPRWEELTINLIRGWYEASLSDLNVVIGPVFDRDSDGLMDSKILDKMIPTDYFAIVTKCTIKVKNLEDCPGDKLTSISFIYPQKLTIPLCLVEADEFARLFRAKMADVQRLTGLLFFPKLDPRLRLSLITQEYSPLWLFANPPKK